MYFNINQSSKISKEFILTCRREIFYTSVQIVTSYQLISCFMNRLTSVMLTPIQKRSYFEKEKENDHKRKIHQNITGPNRRSNAYNAFRGM